MARKSKGQDSRTSTIKNKKKQSFQINSNQYRKGKRIKKSKIQKKISRNNNNKRKNNMGRQR